MGTDMDNGLSVTFTIRLSPDELAKMPHGVLNTLCGVAREVVMAQAKTLLAEHELTIGMMKRQIASLEELKAWVVEKQAENGLEKVEVAEPPKDEIAFDTDAK